MGERDETPNHREFFLHTITGQVPPLCGSEMVDIRGLVTLKFGFKKVDLPGRVPSASFSLWTQI